MSFKPIQLRWVGLHFLCPEGAVSTSLGHRPRKLFPEGRGQGVGGRKKKTKNEKEVELNTCGKAFEEDFGNMEVLIKEEEVCDFPGGDAA